MNRKKLRNTECRVAEHFPYARRITRTFKQKPLTNKKDRNWECSIQMISKDRSFGNIPKFIVFKWLNTNHKLINTQSSSLDNESRFKIQQFIYGDCWTFSWSWFVLFLFHSISTIVGYLILNHLYTHTLNIYTIIKHILLITFLNEPEIFFAEFNGFKYCNITVII